MEKHSDGGYHYHVALKFSGPKRWLEAKRALEAEHGIVVNFSDHKDYYTAYQYINKYDDKVYRSTGHPDLHEIGSPKTKRCQQLYRKRRGDKMNEPTKENTAECSTSSKRKRNLSNLKVADFIVEKGIKSETELLAIANEQKEEGKKDLADFCAIANFKISQRSCPTNMEDERGLLDIRTGKNVTDGLDTKGS